MSPKYAERLAFGIACAVLLTVQIPSTLHSLTLPHCDISHVEFPTQNNPLA